ncbi:MAG: magnesium transporter [Burkholderiales bacterium]
MAEIENIIPEEASLQETLKQVTDMLGHEKDAVPMNLEDNRLMRTKLDALHPADVAFILESLPVAQRLIVWDLVKADRDGEILLEVSDSVRESLIKSMDSEELLHAAERLDTDEIADLAPDLPRDVMQELIDSLDAQNRARLQSAMAYPENSVGALMDFDMVAIRDDINLEVVLRYLRRRGELPAQTDQLFVVDRDDKLLGTLPLNKLLILDPEKRVADVMEKPLEIFHPEGEAHAAAGAFERYDLISSPVVDAENKLIGRVTVNEMVDYIIDESEAQSLKRAGLRDEEDLFAPVKESTKNRTLWLGINLLTAFAASAVTGLFSASIEKIVALAVLMTVIPSMGGNAGTQTMALVTRGLALDQINAGNLRYLFKKELLVAYFNALIWAFVVGLVATIFYKDWKLSLVFGAAMIIELFVAAASGVAIPLMLKKYKLDPALGTTVILTTITDVVGLGSFLGLATLFLL